jgi:UDP-GlcNAc:undecaprenyl-phosphate/decaprenyl-phosphate GlcNAc-1-phosphate transferase
MSAAIYVLPLISVVIGLQALAIGRRFGLIDHPGALHKTHDKPTPLVGGFTIALPLLTFCAITLWKQPESGVYAALLVAISGTFLLGFFDDRRTLPSLFRLIYGAALSLTCIAILPALIVTDFDFTFLSQPIPLAPFAIAFSVLVSVGLMNAINMMDGMNGLVGGLCLIWTLLLLPYSPADTLPIVLLLAPCLAVTLIFNLRGKLFLGDSGTYSTGMVVSLLTIYTYNESSIRLPADTIVAWFIIPVLDCLRLMLVRALARKSMLMPDTNHLHHLLQRLMPKPWVVMSIWVMVAVPGLVSMAMPSWTLAAVLTVTVLYVGLLLWAFRERLRHERKIDAKLEAPLCVQSD